MIRYRNSTGRTQHLLLSHNISSQKSVSEWNRQVITMQDFKFDSYHGGLFKCKLLGCYMAHLSGFWIATILHPSFHWCCWLCKGSVLLQETDSHLQHPKPPPPALVRSRSGSLPNCRYANAAARTGAVTYGREKRSRAVLVQISFNWHAAISGFQSDSSRNLQQKSSRSLWFCASTVKYSGPSFSPLYPPISSKWFINSWVYLNPVLQSGIGAFDVLPLLHDSLPVHLRRTLFVSPTPPAPDQYFTPNTGS